MIVSFNAGSSGSAQFIGKANNGYVKIWSFFPVWIGKSRAGLESPQPNPTAANLSVRDGMYIVTQGQTPGSFTPVVLPWTGDIYLLNDGTQPNEQINNIAIIDVENTCG